MSECKRLHLGEILHFQNGRAFSKSEWSRNGLPIVRIANLTRNDAPFNYYEGDFDSRIFVNDGDLLFSWSATLSVHTWDRGPALLNQHIYKVTPSPMIEPRYAHYALEQVITRAAEHLTGATMKHLTKGSLESLEIALPPLDEQKRIVARLDEVFHHVAVVEAVRRAKVADTPQLLSALREQLLTTANEDAVLTRLGDVAAVEGGYAFKSSRYRQKGHYLVRIGSVRDGQVRRTDETCVNLTEDSRLARFALAKGDVLLTLTGNMGRAAVVHEELLPAALNQRVARVRAHAGLSIDAFLRHVLDSAGFQEHVRRNGHGTAQLNISTKDIEAFEFLLPNLERQKAIADQLDSASHLTAALSHIDAKHGVLLKELVDSIVVDAVGAGS